MSELKGAQNCLELDVERLLKLLELFDGVHLLVVGDVLLDEYLWGDAERISPEAPVPVVRIDRESVVLGGAGNVVQNLLALGGRCSFSTVVGDDPDGQQVRELLSLQGVSTAGVVVENGRPTARKTRVVSRGSQMIRFDRETTLPVADEISGALVECNPGSEGPLDGAILADYGKGLFTPSFTRALIRRLVKEKVPVAVDPKGELSIYRGASLLKPNGFEALDLVGADKFGDPVADRFCLRAQRVLGDIQIVVTEGADGMAVFDGTQPGIRVPTIRREVFDVQGAGDTAMAALSLALRVGASLVEAALIANVAAGVVVNKTGTATVTRNEVRGLLPDTVARLQEVR